MRNENATCASCREFPLDKTGQAQCEIFERREQWDNRACVLYTRAADTSARWALAVSLSDKKSQGTE
jgi:hypothetical protein